MKNSRIPALAVAMGAYFLYAISFNHAQIPSGSNRNDQANRNPTTKMRPRTPHLVGRRVCRECHLENYKLHANHGHAATFHLVSNTDVATKFAGRSFDGGQHYGVYEYQTDDEGRLFTTLPERFGNEPFRLQYVLGSGQNAQTMLTLTPGLDGETEGIEHRVTCYSNDRLGLSPGHENMTPRSALEYFGDMSRDSALERCIYCHTTSGRIAGQEIVDLIPGVNCEKCHGPGSEHVKSARQQPKPVPYSVGLPTWDIESEIQLCGDCHRLPKSVSDSELREYPDLITRFQPIGLLRSKCYLESQRTLRCTTCHNPHQSLHQGSESNSLQSCIQCHQQGTNTHVICPISPDTGCVECHMPAIELDNGLTFHDHWIRVRKK